MSRRTPRSAQRRAAALCGRARLGAPAQPPSLTVQSFSRTDFATKSVGLRRRGGEPRGRRGASRACDAAPKRAAGAVSGETCSPRCCCSTARARPKLGRAAGSAGARSAPARAAACAAHSGYPPRRRAWTSRAWSRSACPRSAPSATPPGRPCRRFFCWRTARRRPAGRSGRSTAAYNEPKQRATRIECKQKSACAVFRTGLSRHFLFSNLSRTRLCTVLRPCCSALLTSLSRQPAPAHPHPPPPPGSRDSTSRTALRAARGAASQGRASSRFV